MTEHPQAVIIKNWADLYYAAEPGDLIFHHIADTARAFSHDWDTVWHFDTLLVIRKGVEGEMRLQKITVVTPKGDQRDFTAVTFGLFAHQIKILKADGRLNE